MRKLFFGYYSPTEDEFNKLWMNGTFFFDANAILNLYSYSEPARNDMIKILKYLANRIVIPHQAALEYQENRFSRIFEQKELFKKVKKIIEEHRKGMKSSIDELHLEKRHSTINATDFIKALNEICDEFTKKLKELEENQQDVHEEDKIRKILDDTLGNKTGSPLTKEDLEALYGEGEKRYKRKQPPGYMDLESKKDEPPYHYKDLIIKRQFGDLIIWDQIIREAKIKELKYVIFITDDTKEDWWWTKKGKKLGPRPELIQEIQSKANISYFWIYSSENFMKHASDYFKLKIPEGSIKQVRDAIKIGKIVELKDDPENIKINITFSNKFITGELHRYSLIITVSSLCYSEVHLEELALLWPPSVRPSHLYNVKFRQNVKLDNEIFNELVLHIDEPLYPGNTLGLIGFNDKRGIIYYEYDHDIFDKMIENPKDLKCMLRVSGWPVIFAKKPFSELNMF